MSPRKSTLTKVLVAPMIEMCETFVEPKDGKSEIAVLANGRQSPK